MYLSHACVDRFSCFLEIIDRQGMHNFDGGRARLVLLMYFKHKMPHIL